MSAIASIESAEFGAGTCRVAVIGAGISGSACAAALAASGFEVDLFDKSADVGGRMALHEVGWFDATGTEHASAFDHGVQDFSACSPRFRAVVARAAADGAVVSWRQHVFAPFPAAQVRDHQLPVPGMPSFCLYLLGGLPVHLKQPVERLMRVDGGWELALSGGGSAGPFGQVMLAMPPAQAALLLAGHRDDWADELAAVRMKPCWTLTAVTDDVDWPWDAAEPEQGPIAWVSRNDRKPGRPANPGFADWVVHATAVWSEAHLEDDPEMVKEVLTEALRAVLPAGNTAICHYAAVHRWRYAGLAEPAAGESKCWWDRDQGLGVCGDSFGNGEVEAAWRSGDELADTVTAGLDEDTVEAPMVSPGAAPAPARRNEAVPQASSQY